tara:strand:- start:3169 stop:3363 length:195 start_codon:yes stop_codon:yes gene_type:complete
MLWVGANGKLWFSLKPKRFFSDKWQLSGIDMDHPKVRTWGGSGTAANSSTMSAFTLIGYSNMAS